VSGGFSKEKMASLVSTSSGGSRAEGRVHEDMWALRLKPLLTSDGPAGALIAVLLISLINGHFYALLRYFLDCII